MKYEIIHQMHGYVRSLGSHGHKVGSLEHNSKRRKMQKLEFF